MVSERESRLEKLENLREEGRNPFKHSFKREQTVEELLEYRDQDNPDLDVRTAGRVMEKRHFGGIAFLDLQGEKSEIQVMTQDEDLLDKIEHDIQNGDIIGVEGGLTTTEKGEFSIKATNIIILTKGVRPIPSEFYGLEDEEKKYSDRPLHLITDKDARETFRKRSEAVSAVRDFFEDQGFMEVETPVIQPVYGGANAKPFKTHVEDLDMEAYLRISPELYLKRLIIGGFDRVFEIGKDFRNESIDTTHNPEFTMLELYQAYADYEDMMELTERVYEHVATEVTGSPVVEFEGNEIDLSAPWERKTMREAIEEETGLDLETLSDAELKEELQSREIELDTSFERGLAVAELFEEEVEDGLVGPVHIIDHPEETTPLCKSHREKEGLIERFESFAAGMELSNAYTELRDPVKQRELFEEEQRRQEEGDDEAHPLDMDFVEALELGMPPTGGLGIGIDRMVMLLTDQSSIKDVLLFPMTKS